MKPLFLLMQCVRLLHTDPWQEYTHHILEIGNYSYRTQIVTQEYKGSILYGEERCLAFYEQSRYEIVDCPTDYKGNSPK